MASTTPNAPPVDRHEAPATGGTKSKPVTATPAIVLGINGILFSVLLTIVGIISGAVAIGLGASAKKEINRGGLEGRGQAQAGFVLGIISVAIGIALIAIAVVAAT